MTSTFFGVRLGYASLGDITGDGVPDFTIPNSVAQVNRMYVYSGAAVNGGGLIDLRVERKLEAAVDGGGNIAYWGNPSVTSAVDGGGSVCAPCAPPPTTTTTTTTLAAPTTTTTL